MTKAVSQQCRFTLCIYFHVGDDQSKNIHDATFEVWTKAQTDRSLHWNFYSINCLKLRCDLHCTRYHWNHFLFHGNGAAISVGRARGAKGLVALSQALVLWRGSVVSSPRRGPWASSPRRGPWASSPRRGAKARAWEFRAGGSRSQN